MRNTSSLKHVLLPTKISITSKDLFTYINDHIGDIPNKYTSSTQMHILKAERYQDSDNI